MNTSEDSIRLPGKPFICLGMTHFPSRATITLPSCRSSICSTFIRPYITFYYSSRKPRLRDSSNGSNQVCQIAFYCDGVTIEKSVKLREICLKQNKTKQKTHQISPPRLARLSCMEQKRRRASRTRF